MVTKRRARTGRPWDVKAGYCRAIRLGNISGFIVTASNAATNPDGSLYAPGDAYAQTKHILGLIEGYLGEVGASLADIIRTRIYVADMKKNLEAVLKAHGEVFGQIRPVATIVPADGWAVPGVAVEIEADAVV